MAGVSKTADKLGNMMYSRRMINCPDTDYVFGEDSKKEMKQEKSVMVEAPLSSQCFIRYWYIEVKAHKVKLQPVGVSRWRWKKEKQQKEM